MRVVSGGRRGWLTTALAVVVGMPIALIAPRSAMAANGTNDGFSVRQAATSSSTPCEPTQIHYVRGDYSVCVRLGSAITHANDVRQVRLTVLPNDGQTLVKVDLKPPAAKRWQSFVQSHPKSTIAISVGGQIEALATIQPEGVSTPFVILPDEASEAKARSLARAIVGPKGRVVVQHLPPATMLTLDPAS